jgi:hypothetical protein
VGGQDFAGVEGDGGDGGLVDQGQDAGAAVGGGDVALRDLFTRGGALIKKMLHMVPAPDPRPYLKPESRPSLRQGVVDKVWKNAKGPDGLVRDPNTGDVIKWTPGTPRRGVWDMGHVPGEKYHDKWLDYVARKLTPEEFRDWYNDPANYRPKLPSDNRGHRYE